jgi:beta-phosphoglucomutase-like phosphatase (HAD superfamily)
MTDIIIEAVLFDKDGTIFDSETLSFNAWVNTAEKYGIMFTAEDYEHFIGVPTAECYQIARTWFGDGIPMDSFIEQMRAYINAHKTKGLIFKKGFNTFFNHVKVQGLSTGIVTSAGLRSTLLSFQNTNLYQTIDALVTVDDVINPKPSPECYLMACRKLNVLPSRTLVFEDSNIGLRAAIAAQCQVVAIPDRMSVDVDVARKCMAVIDSFDDAHQYL